MNVGNNDLAILGLSLITHNLQLNAKHMQTHNFQQPCMLHPIDSVTLGKASGCIRTEQLMGMMYARIPSGEELSSPGSVGGGGGSSQASTMGREDWNLS